MDWRTHENGRIDRDRGWHPGCERGWCLAEKVTVTGTVTDTFGQRYVVDEGGKKSLVDIWSQGPRDAVSIKTGDKVTVEGELTDAGEVHATQVAVGAEKAVVLPAENSWLERLTGAKDDKAPFGPVEARAMVTKAGYETVGEPKPEKAFRGAGQEGWQILRRRCAPQRRTQEGPRRRCV